MRFDVKLVKRRRFLWHLQTVFKRLAAAAHFGEAHHTIVKFLTVYVRTFGDAPREVW